jgi:hypothetical protein
MLLHQIDNSFSMELIEVSSGRTADACASLDGQMDQAGSTFAPLLCADQVLSDLQILRPSEVFHYCKVAVLLACGLHSPLKERQDYL